MIRIPPAVDMQFNSVTSISPSFTSYSSNNLADIAARVVEEYRNENGHEEDDDIYTFTDDNNINNNKSDDNQEEEEPEKDKDKEFEFAIVQTNQFNSSSSPVSADEIFYNGEILPRYPLFDRSLLLDDDNGNDVVSNKLKSVTVSKPQRRPLSKLFSEERESVSCSSSESDDLDGVAPETYCVWKPKLESPERCKKSNSTGNTSKRWTLPFRNLLHRSNSDGNLNKDALLKVKKFEKTSKVAGADDEIDEINSSKGGKRLRSYLSNKHDVVGLFGNVNGLNRNLRPF